VTVPTSPLLHPVQRAAERLGVSESSIWRLLRLGKLHPTCVLGRTMISEGELQRLVTETTKPRQIAPQPVTGMDVNAGDTASPDGKPKSRRRQPTK
jgi:Helix-turn-helix domain